MRIVRLLNAGAVLAELTAREFNLLRDGCIGKAELLQLAESLFGPAPAMAIAPRTPPPPPAPAPSVAERSEEAPPQRLCLHCHQPIPADAHHARKVHEACLKPYAAANAKAAYHAAHPSARTAERSRAQRGSSSPSPSRPPRVTETDPLARASALHRQIAQEE
jgi:hypothetical protein